MRVAKTDGDFRVDKLIELCRSLRKGRRRPRYTESIKDLVRQLVQSGVDLRVVAKSSGITPHIARKWLDHGQLPAAAQAVQMLRVEDAALNPRDDRRVLLSLKTSEFEVAVYAVTKGVA